MRTRHQSGYLYKRSGAWWLRFYDVTLQENGSTERIQKARRIASTRECSSKAEARLLADEFLAPLNAGELTAAGTMSLRQFVDAVYLPHVAEQCRPSTLAGYRDVWKRYLQPRCGSFRLRDFRTWDGERLMQEIARHSNINRTTLKHIKSLMSGIFKHAKRQGALNGVNPMQDVSIPKAPEGRETYAYSLEEITRMLMVVPEPAATIIAAAAFTGARRGEIAGLLWENYNGHEIKVTQSVWRGHISEPKTRRSRSSIPVIAPLARMLDRHRSESSVRTSGLIFMNARGGVICLEDLARRVVRPALEKAGIDWHGWHSFRRGLATNLYRLGVPDKSIQGILRHSNVSTTMNSYVKSVSADAVAAMKMLESVCTKHAQGNAQASALVM